MLSSAEHNARLKGKNKVQDMGLVEVNLPHEFDLRVYQTPLWEYMMQQKPGLRALTVWPRRNGKDLVALNILVAKAMQRVGLYLYIGPLHKQTRQIIWLGNTNDGRKFLDYIPQPLIKKQRNSQMEIELINGSMIVLVGSDNYDSLMGLNAAGAVFTEYSLQKPQAWEYIRPMLASNGGWALFNGTPRTEQNHMYAMSRMAQENPDWFYQYLTRDGTGFPTLEAIEDDRRAGMPESLIEQEYYCSWSASTESTLIPMSLVEPCIDAAVDFDWVQANPRIMGVDVAYAENGDSAAIARRQGTLLHPIEKYQGMDNMTFATKVAMNIKNWNPKAVFIDAGRGEGVISRLSQLGYGHLIYPVNFGGKTFDDLYNRKKDQMWGHMKDWFSDPVHRPSVPNEPDLLNDITCVRFEINERGFVQIESKKQLMKRGISSTDDGDAVALTFAEEIALDVIEDKLSSLGLHRSQDPYDPMNYMDNITEQSGPAINPNQTLYDNERMMPV